MVSQLPLPARTADKNRGDGISRVLSVGSDLFSVHARRLASQNVALNGPPEVRSVMSVMLCRTAPVPSRTGWLPRKWDLHVGVGGWVTWVTPVPEGLPTFPEGSRAEKGIRGFADLQRCIDLERVFKQFRIPSLRDFKADEVQGLRFSIITSLKPEKAVTRRTA